MNQREYELIAAVFVYTKEQGIPRVDPETVDTTARFMALFLQHNYPKTFDRAKFLKACGL
jgi:hypothetical protein